METQSGRSLKATPWQFGHGSRAEATAWRGTRTVARHEYAIARLSRGFVGVCSCGKRSRKWRSRSWVTKVMEAHCYARSEG